MYGRHLRVHDTSAMKILVDLLSDPRSQHACETPLKAGDIAPNTIIQCLTLGSWVRRLEGAPLAIQILAPQTRYYELSSDWLEELFSSQTKISESSAIQTPLISILDSDFHGWPLRPIAPITHLFFANGILDVNEVAWEKLGALRSLAIRVSSPKDIARLSDLADYLQETSPNLERLALVGYAELSMIRSVFAALVDKGVELCTMQSCASENPSSIWERRWSTL